MQTSVVRSMFMFYLHGNRYTAVSLLTFYSILSYDCNSLFNHCRLSVKFDKRQHKGETDDVAVMVLIIVLNLFIPTRWSRP